MSDQENSVSPQLKVVQEWRKGFQTKDMGVIAKYLHKDYRHRTYPHSLGLPEQTKEQWLEYLARDFDHWKDAQPTVHSITEAPGKVIIHFTTKAKTTLGSEVTRESILIGQIVTDEDGSLKIKQIEEFTDSKAHLDTTQQILAAKANK